jgi:hypothetical protein
MGIRGPAILAGAAATENIVALCGVDETRAATKAARGRRPRQQRAVEKIPS